MENFIIRINTSINLIPFIINYYFHTIFTIIASILHILIHLILINSQNISILIINLHFLSLYYHYLHFFLF